MQCLPDHAKSVGRRDKFEISSTLRYSGSIWTSIYRLIKGDTTVYNEINLPDLGNVFECYISYIKKMIIVMTIVAATFLLTYTIITQTGISLVTKIIKGIWFILTSPIYISCWIYFFVKRRRARNRPKTKHLA
ncbi:hypothetical protein B9Z55_028249 [Caenorhabditis nigoni]|uniref:Uncharacterized protein n=1 Tax=Caenorhabditis nigoni TaxID=1611254 RepID=A0A2G5SCV1_9PELO|nr:hypothetical protein B9Z55_028249 [Caenorhabditis nigoni]